jgi:hypothetical protein
MASKRGSLLGRCLLDGQCLLDTLSSCSPPTLQQQRGCSITRSPAAAFLLDLLTKLELTAFGGVSPNGSGHRPPASAEDEVQRQRLSIAGGMACPPQDWRWGSSLLKLRSVGVFATPCVMAAAPDVAGNRSNTSCQLPLLSTALLSRSLHSKSYLAGSIGLEGGSNTNISSWLAASRAAGKHSGNGAVTARAAAALLSARTVSSNAGRREVVWTLPNALSMLRLGLAPLAAACIVQEQVQGVGG